MAGDTLAQASVIRFRSSCNVGGVGANTRCLMYPHRKKSNGFRSGERGGHSTQPPYPMTCCWNVSRMYCWTLDTLCGGTPSCWNHTFRSFFCQQVPLTPVSRPSNPAMVENFQSSSTSRDFSTSIEKPTLSQQYLLGKPGLPKAHYYLLLIIQGFLSTIHNGVLLSIQTYSCLPYGSLAYHVTVTLSSFANPLCCFVAIFFPVTNIYAVAGLSAFTTVWSVYVLVIALLSPTPPFVDLALGATLIVIAWIMVSGSVAFTKACIASILRREGGQVALFRCGVVTQLGSAIGALVTFLLIQYTTLFKSYTPCT
ncbi:Solute carrier family 52, riboflavin transporter, member 3-B [Araneus ventricosus]|uniref:Riboflavin transporter n=1 Tax=Araneus ventricosus TaxID=182803 RepID=A0A4Y2J9K6_ARAVE|nr:Solute carrier family 52, riboflavin transporter, member 3-B [Araneus ventricosus]